MPWRAWLLSLAILSACVLGLVGSVGHALAESAPVAEVRLEGRTVAQEATPTPPPAVIEVTQFTGEALDALRLLAFFGALSSAACIATVFAVVVGYFR